MPQARYDRARDQLAQKLVDKAKEKFAPGESFSETQVRRSVLSVFEAVRAMDQVNFSIQKDQIAQKLSDDIMPAKASLSRADKIKKFLLAKNTVAILRARLNPPVVGK